MTNITEEQKKMQEAFGAGFWKRNPKPDGVKRWMDDKSQVEFTDFVFPSEYNRSNAILTVNGDANYKIWYSQLQGYYFSPEEKYANGYVEGSLIFKNGEKYIFNELEPEKFWELARGKRFEVEAFPDFSKIDKDSTKVQEMRTYDKVIAHISTAIKHRDWEKIYGMLKSAPVYSLTEI